MLMKPSRHVFIVGSGVIGLAIGTALLKMNSSLKVSIFEKESGLGFHASGRNSGVIHAGFYYSPDSLKAKFCSSGNQALTQLIKRHDLSLRKTGKIVVTQDRSQLDDLVALQQRGVANGVSLEILEGSELKKFEPLAQTCEAFIWSPNTSVADPSEVIAAMASEYENLGGVIYFNQSVEGIDDGHIVLDSEVLPADLVINCAGTQALRLAHGAGVGLDMSQLPFIGLYRYTQNSNLPLKTLVYPVPDKNYPFLGVHFTLSIAGKVKVGPTAIPVLGSEQYSLFKGTSFLDMKQSIASLFALAKKNLNQTIRLAEAEIPNVYHRNMIQKAVMLVPKSAEVLTWERYRPGIRAQLVDKKTGNFLQDFKITKTQSVIHVLNSVSPGWTSSIPFGSWVADQAIEMLG
jgi:L-2-hydroxyglutarate oxidase